MAGPRREKVSDLVREEVARLLQREVHDARLGFVTVTDVRMSPDLKHARVFVSLFSEGEARDKAVDALHAARGFIRRRLGQTLRLRYTPEIAFSLDTSIEYGAKIDSLIESTRSPERSAGSPDAADGSERPAETGTTPPPDDGGREEEEEEEE